MHVTLHRWSENGDWGFPEQDDTRADWVLYFGSNARLEGPSAAPRLTATLKRKSLPSWTSNSPGSAPLPTPLPTGTSI